MSGVFRLPMMGSGVQEVKDYLVRFIDYDGEVLKEQWVNSGEDATAPETPEHEDLEFYEWNKGFTNVTKNLDVGAIYESASGNAHIDIEINANSGLSFTMYLFKSAATPLTIYWGDGMTEVWNTSGNISISKTYASSGNYRITIASADNFNFGWNNSSYKAFSGNFNGIITNLILSGKSLLSNYCFQNCRNLKTVSFGEGITNIPAYAFQGWWRIKGVTLSSNVTSIGTHGTSLCTSMLNVSLPESLVTLSAYAFYYALSLKSVIIPSSVTVIKNQIFFSAGALNRVELQGNVTQIGTEPFYGSTVKSIDVPATVTYLYNAAFSTIYGLEELIFRSTTPPTLAAATVFNFQTMMRYHTKIYVPDASVNAYKTATNWNAHADYIYPLSTRP